MSSDAVPRPNDLSLCHQIIDEQQTTIDQLQRELAQAKHFVEQLLRSRYGPRSKRVDPNQLSMFDAGDLDDSAPALLSTRDEADGLIVYEHVRRGGGRRRLPDHLPREIVDHDLAEGEKACPCCGKTRQRIGCETSEQLEFVPAVLKVIEHRRWKYACRRCEELVIIAPVPDKPIAKGLPGPGLLAAWWSASTLIISRCTGWKTCSPAAASNYREVRCAVGRCRPLPFWNRSIR